MNGKNSMEILKERVLPVVQNDAESLEAIETALNSLKTIEKVKDLIFKYRCSAVTMRNQKTYFTEHDIGYCKGALEVFEEVERDIEGLLKENKIL